MFTPELVTKTLISFKPFKAAGTDGIFNALLQNGADLLSLRVASIYNACIRLGIHQVGERSSMLSLCRNREGKLLLAKSYRPISLISFQLKSMKRICDDLIKRQIPPNRLTFRKHTYVKGKSVDTALNEVIGTIESS